MLKQIAILIAIILVSSCAAQPCVYSEVILPPEPAYKKISGERLQCLEQETYSDLVVSTEKCRSHTRELRALIHDHNGKETNE